ncbi:MAG: peptidylprolyl isomerase [Myxococcota bacterium]
MRTASVLLAGIVIVGAAGCERTESPAAGSAPAEASETTEAIPRPAWPSWGGVPWPTAGEALSSALRVAELNRDAEAEAIDQAWHHEDPAWRARSAWTLARIGGPQALEILSKRLLDGRVELDASTLAAIGFLEAPGADGEPRGDAWDDLEDLLWTRYAVTEDAEQADALLLAIARIGGARSPVRLAADLAVLPSAGEEPRHVHAMEALAISCVRGYALPIDGLRAVALGLTAEGPALRRAAAFALARCAAVSAERLAGEERGELVSRLVPIIEGDDPDGARQAWRALEGLGERLRVVPEWVLGKEGGDWMAEVAAVRALAAHADGRKVLARRMSQVNIDDFEGPRLHVLRELFMQLRTFAAHEPQLETPLKAVADALRRSTAKQHRATALTLLNCEAQVLLATLSGELEAVRGCAKSSPSVPDEHGDRMVIEALVNMGTVLPREQKVAALLEAASDARPSVRAPAVTALAGLDDPGVAEARRKALADEDMGVVAAAAGAVGQRASDQSRRDPEAIPLLRAVIGRFDDQQAIETRIAAIDALGRLSRSEPEPEPGTKKPDWLEKSVAPLGRHPASAIRAAARRALQGQPELLEPFDALPIDETLERFAPAVHQAAESGADRAMGLRVHTDVGSFTIDFSGAPAPIAQANLAALATSGFFERLTFHRVVPGFVVQGGDPRGDGYGGPGHVMPCEWSNLRYERGTVGIALAGKDTGGSQLFIAHDAARHLDARYTVIGRVVAGMEVVDQLWPYDRISRVEVLDEPPTASEAR